MRLSSFSLFTAILAITTEQITLNEHQDLVLLPKSSQHIETYIKSEPVWHKKRSDSKETEHSLKVSPSPINSKTLEYSKLTLEKKITELFGDFKNLKIAVTKSPFKLESEYPKLKLKYHDVISKHRRYTSNEICLSEETSKTLNDLITLHQMLELNISLRKKNCARALTLHPLQNQANGEAAMVVKKTLVDVELTHLENWVEDLIRPCGMNDLCGTRVGSAKAELMRLSKESESKFNEARRIHLLFREVYYDYARIIENIKSSVRFELEYPVDINLMPSQGIITDGSRDEYAKSMEEHLNYWYFGMHMYLGKPDYKWIHDWRMHVRLLADECFENGIDMYDDLRMSGVKSAIEHITEYLRAQSSGLVLQAIRLCANGVFSNETMQKFSLIYKILLSNVRYTEEKLRKSVIRMRNLEADISNLSFREANRRFRTEISLYERIQSGLFETNFVILPEAEQVNNLEEQAYIISKKLKSLMNEFKKVEGAK